MIFYVPEGTTITMSYSYQDGKYSNRADPCTFNWIPEDEIYAMSLRIENKLDDAVFQFCAPGGAEYFLHRDHAC